MLRKRPKSFFENLDADGTISATAEEVCTYQQASSPASSLTVLGWVAMQAWSDLYDMSADMTDRERHDRLGSVSNEGGGMELQDIRSSIRDVSKRCTVNTRTLASHFAHHILCITCQCRGHTVFHPLI